ENALMFSLITQGLGALFNIGLNFLLIPRHGAEGAAMATVISYAIASYGALLLHPKTRPVFFMMTRSLFSTFRYAYSAVRATRRTSEQSPRRYPSRSRRPSNSPVMAWGWR